MTYREHYFLVAFLAGLLWCTLMFSAYWEGHRNSRIERARAHRCHQQRGVWESYPEGRCLKSADTLNTDETP